VGGYRVKEATRLVNICLEAGVNMFDTADACEGSLRRLRVDYIDIYQIHGFDALSPVEETLGTLVWSPLGWGRPTGKIRRNRYPYWHQGQVVDRNPPPT
jgi:aryl-alcohol dehydrogenase-like predicted oxidoreductase